MKYLLHHPERPGVEVRDDLHTPGRYILRGFFRCTGFVLPNPDNPHFGCVATLDLVECTKLTCATRVRIYEHQFTTFSVKYPEDKMLLLEIDCEHKAMYTTHEPEYIG